MEAAQGEKRRIVVAAILAVYGGRISADDALRLMQNPQRAEYALRAMGLPPVVISDGDGQYTEHDLFAVASNLQKSRRALADIGFTPRAQETLLAFQAPADAAALSALSEALKKVEKSRTRKIPREDGPGSPAAPTRQVEKPPEETHKTTSPPQSDVARTMRITTGRITAGPTSTERYEIKREHARGGMGRVLVVRDHGVGRDIALKELLPGMAKGFSVPPSEGADSGGPEERFLREAKITGQLEHPNIVPVYEIGRRSDGSLYYTMRFIRGQTLAQRMKSIRDDETLPRKAKQAARIALLDSFVDVCDAISYAHSKGVIHRDIKPENIMLGDYGETLVLDWGLARVKGHEDKALDELREGTVALSKSLVVNDASELTQDGSVVGTPAYMPPEQARGDLEDVDEQSDVYALGAVLYQILCGTPPYEGAMAGLVLQQVIAGPPLRLSAREPDVPPELAALVERAMAREKWDRLGTVRELAAEIKAFRDGRTLGVYRYSTKELFKRYLRQHRATVSVGVLGFLLLVAGAILAYWQVSGERDEARNAHAQTEIQRKQAQDNLDLFQSEKEKKEALERDARENARKLLESRIQEAQRLLVTLQGMRIEEIAADLGARISGYESNREKAGTEFLDLEADERTRNGVLLSSLMGYISARQSLIELLRQSGGASLPEPLATMDVEAEAAGLGELRVKAARLAAFNADFELAVLMISGVTDQSVANAERARVDAARAGLLQQHSKRIADAIADVKADLRREGRSKDAPGLTEYVRQLSGFGERETVHKLEPEVTALRAKARVAGAWLSPAEMDMAVLCCRVLARAQQPAESVPLIAGLLADTRDPRVESEAALALCDTGSAEAVGPLLAQMRVRGLDFWAGVEARAARLPLPARLYAPQGAQDHLDRAIMLRARGEHAAAIEAANRAVALDVKAPEPLVHRGLAYAARGDRAPALADFDAALKLDPKNLEALLARADARDIHAQTDQAMADYTEAIAVAPGSPRPLLHRARAHGLVYAYESAFADYDKAAGIDARRIATFIAHGKLLQERGLNDRAEKMFTGAVELEPENWLGYHYRGVLRRHITKFGASIADLKTAIKLDPTDAVAWCFMSQSYFGLMEWVNAIDAATNAVRVNPREWLAFYYRGIAYQELQKLEDLRPADPAATEAQRSARVANLVNAASDFGAAAAINPDDFRSLGLYGVTLARLGRYEDARAPLERALAISPFGSGTLTMGNAWVKSALDDVEAMSWLDRNPAQFDDYLKKARALVVRQQNNATRRKADLTGACEAVRAAVRAAGAEIDARRKHRLFVVRQALRDALASQSADAELAALHQEVDAALHEGPEPAADAVIVISRVNPSAPADKMGMKVFDVVRTVNGVKVANFPEFQSAMAQVPENAECVFEVERYVLKNGRPVPRRDAKGEVIRDAQTGLCSWEFTPLTLRARRGFLGIGLDPGVVPHPAEE